MFSCKFNNILSRRYQRVFANFKRKSYHECMWLCIYSWSHAEKKAKYIYITTLKTSQKYLEFLFCIYFILNLGHKENIEIIIIARQDWYFSCTTDIEIDRQWLTDSFEGIDIKIKTSRFHHIMYWPEKNFFEKKFFWYLL